MTKYIGGNKSCDNILIHLAYKGGHSNRFLENQSDWRTIWSSNLKNFVILVTCAHLKIPRPTRASITQEYHDAIEDTQTYNRSEAES